jgi:2-keto-4-pentenoate hydratase/2-oxohepta-3-ene-1,7-dioic acid hydratase in catechol pathway
VRIANVSGRAKLVRDARVIDIGTASAGRFPSDSMALLGHWNEVRAWAADVDAVGGEAIDEQLLDAPVTRPRQVFAVASNYHDRPALLPTPTDLPVTFTKFPGSICGPWSDLPLPTETVDWEVELVVVIGQAIRAITASEAWAAIAGLTVGQDYSERALQLGGPVKQFSLGKSFPAFGPIGPMLVTPDEFADPDDLHLWCRINGDPVQDASTRQMIFPVAELVARLSGVCWLFPGDLIFTGTPGGLGMQMQPPRYLRVGDEVRSGVDGIGELRNRCVAGV